MGGHVVASPPSPLNHGQNRQSAAVDDTVDAIRRGDLTRLFQSILNMTARRYLDLIIVQRDGILPIESLRTNALLTAVVQVGVLQIAY